MNAQQQMHNLVASRCRQLRAVSGSFLRSSPGRGYRPPGPPQKAPPVHMLEACFVGHAQSDHNNLTTAF
eukprot:15471604-Alexandrium_andersonii.AAC.1